MGITRFLRFTFIVHFIIMISLGVLFYYPQLGSAFLGVPLEPFVDRLVGAFFFAFAYSSWWGYKANDWDKVKIVVQMNGFWLVFAFTSTLVFADSLAQYLIAALFAFLLVMFAYVELSTKRTLAFVDD